MKASGDNNDSKSYIDSARELVIMLLKYEEGNRNLLSLLYPLLPVKFRGQIQSIATVMRSKKAKSEQDKIINGTVDSKINPILFKKSTLQFVKSDANTAASDMSVLEAKQNETEKKNALLIANELKSSAQSKVQEYMSARKRGTNRNKLTSSMDSITRPKSSDSSHAINKVGGKGLKRSSARALHMAMVKNESQGMPSNSDPIVKSIQRAESASFRSGNVKKIKSSVPKNMICQICQNQMRRPLLATCGHSACADCWKHWLSRSNEKCCFLCRRPTNPQDLAHLIFQQSEKGLPTISQICPDQEEDSDNDSSSDELEIIGK